MLSIPFVATSDNYGDATTLTHQLGKSVSFTIANNPVAYQLGFLDKAGEIHWSEEIPSNPIDGGFSNVAGIRFRSWNKGKPAVVVATLFLETDPTPLGATAYTASLTASGGQTPGLSSVQIDHNGVAISTEPILDFQDGNGFTWAITDVPGSQKATIALASPISGYEPLTPYTSNLTFGPTGVTPTGSGGDYLVNWGNATLENVTYYWELYLGTIFCTTTAGWIYFALYDSTNLVQLSGWQGLLLSTNQTRSSYHLIIPFTPSSGTRNIQIKWGSDGVGGAYEITNGNGGAFSVMSRLFKRVGV